MGEVKAESEGAGENGLGQLFQSHDHCESKANLFLADRASFSFLGE